jgi:hypothetical protein
MSPPRGSGRRIPGAAPAASTAPGSPVMGRQGVAVPRPPVGRAWRAPGRSAPGGELPLGWGRPPGHGQSATEEGQDRHQPDGGDPLSVPSHRASRWAGRFLRSDHRRRVRRWRNHRGAFFGGQRLRKTQEALHAAMVDAAMLPGLPQQDLLRSRRPRVESVIGTGRGPMGVTSSRQDGWASRDFWRSGRIRAVVLQRTVSPGAL